MASSACSPSLAAHGHVFPSPPSSWGTFFPRRSVVPHPVQAPIRRSGESEVRAKAEVRKYRGMRIREKHMAKMIEEMVQEALVEIEGDDQSDECKVAWDEVEEVSRAKADLRRRLGEGDADPLEWFCQENPDTDECRVYED